MNNKLKNTHWYQSLLVFLPLGLVACTGSYTGEPPDQITPTPTIRPTEVPTLTKSATPIQLPSATKALPEQPSTPEPLLHGPLAAFTATDASGKDYALILDLDTGSVRKLSWDNGTPAQLEWQNDGCKVDVTIATALGVELINTDLHNRQPETIFTGGKRVDGGFLTSPVVDPNRKWIAYTVLSGAQTYEGAEFENIEVMAIGSQSAPVTLTTRGGASKAAWSPDGEHLSYSDYDSAGIAQLYSSNPDGKEKSQLTRFAVPGTKISIVQWSPTGNAIAFVTHTDKGSGSVWTISRDGAKLTKATIKDTDAHIDKIWWSEDGQIIVAYARSADGQSQKDAIYWIDPANGRILHALEASDTPEKYISQPFPVGGVQVVGFVGDQRIWFYDVKTGRIEEKQYALDWADLTGPAQSSPATFQGEAACKIR